MARHCTFGSTNDRLGIFCATKTHLSSLSLVSFICQPEKLDPEDSERVLDKTRKLGLVVVRGTQVSLVSPEDGLEPIANPFIAQE